MAAPKKSDHAALKAFKQELKNDTLGKLYVFHGEETYLREHYVGELKKKLLPAGLEEFNLHTIPGKSLTPQLLAQTVDCLPMMSERTLILVTDYDLYGGTADAREELAELFADLPDYCCLVFVYDLLPYKADARTKMAAALKKYGSVVGFHRQEQGDLVDWLGRRFKAGGHSIGTEEARYLLFLCGDLMNNLITEVDKISAYAKHPRITREDIDAVAIPVVDAVVFQMTDAIAQGNFDRAAAVMSDLLSSQESPIMILSVAGKYFRQLYTARLVYERRKGTAELMDMWAMKNSWPAEKLMDAARRYSLPWCRNAVRRCAETDLAMKSYGGDERDLLVGLLMELANEGRDGR